MAGSANAGAILSATGGTINSGGPGFGTLTETFDQTGLSAGYTSGVTDFDTYIASGPTHTLVFAGNEWFSNSGTNSASVTYDLGGQQTIDALALWNEESAGIGLLDLFYSTDDITYNSLVSGLMPTDNLIGSDYGADVFSFSAVSAQYIRFDMSNCPQPENQFTACAIGEVAFRETDNGTGGNGSNGTVPAPATLALLGIGLIGLGLRRRK